MRNRPFTSIHVCLSARPLDERFSMFDDPRMRLNLFQAQSFVGIVLQQLSHVSSVIQEFVHAADLPW